jgi:hypothetical protein
VRIAARHADADVVYLDHDLETVAAYPPDVDVAAVAAVVGELLGDRPKPSASPVWTTFDDRSVVRKVTAGDEHLGWLAFVAARARAGAQAELLMSLLQGSREERRVAASRVRHLQLDLRGDLVVLMCLLEGLSDVAGVQGWTASHLDATRSVPARGTACGRCWWTSRPGSPRTCRDSDRPGA